MCLILLLGVNGGIPASGDGQGRAAREAPPARPAGRAPRRGHDSRDDSPRDDRHGAALEGTGSQALCLIDFFWCQ